MKLIADIRKLPKGVLLAVFAIAIYRAGWAAGDMFMAPFLKTIVADYSKIGFFGSLATFTAAALTIPVGVLADHIRRPSLIRFGLLLYPFAALSYFAAGMAQSIPLLVGAVIIHGFAIPFVWTSSESYIRAESTEASASQAFGLFDSGKFLFLILGAAAAFFIEAIPIYYIFLPVVVSALLAASIVKNLPSKRSKNVSAEKVWKQIKKHHNLLKEVGKDLLTFNGEMYTAMTLALFIRIVGALGTLFIPLYALEHNMSLTHIGLLMVLMHSPALLSFAFARLADKGEKVATIMSGMGIIGLCALGLFIWQDQTWAIFGFSLLMMTGLTLMSPSVYGIITQLSVKKFDGMNTALQNIVSRLGFGIAAIGIGQISDNWGVEFNFLLLALACLGLLVLLTFLRLHWKLENKLWQKNHPKGIHAPYSL